MIKNMASLAEILFMLCYLSRFILNEQARYKSEFAGAKITLVLR